MGVRGGLEDGGGSGEGDTIPGGKLSCIFGKRRDCLDRSQQEQTPWFSPLDHPTPTAGNPLSCPQTQVHPISWLSPSPSRE